MGKMSRSLGAVYKGAGSMKVLSTIRRVFRLRAVSVAVQTVLAAAAFAWCFDWPGQSGDTLLAAVPLGFLFWHAEGKAQAGRAGTLISALLALFQTAVHYPAFAVDAATYAYSPVLLEALALARAAGSWLGWWLLFRAMLGMLYPWLDRHSLSRDDDRSWSAGKAFLLALGVILLFRIPVFLFCFPACFTPDTIMQFKQAFGEAAMTGQHPIAHTMLLKWSYEIGYGLFGTPNGGAAFCAGLQTVFLSCVEALSISYLYRKGCKKGFLAACLAFFALLPFQGVWSVTLVKDVPFAGFVLLLTILLCMLPEVEEKAGLGSVLFFAAFTATSVGVCLMRNAAVVICMIAVLGTVLLYKKHRLALLLSLAVTVAITGAVSALGPKSAAVHALSLPIQHVARVVTDGKELQPQEKEILSHIVDLDKVPETYLPWLSDPMKSLVDGHPGSEAYIREHKLELLRLWAGLGLRYPMEYLKAQIDQTAGYLAPTAYWASDMNPVVADLWRFSRKPAAPGIFVSLFNAAEKAYKVAPIYGLLSSVGFYAWGMFVLLGYAAARRGRLWILLPGLGLWLYCMIAAPVFAEFRYLYPLVISMPLLAGTALGHSRGEGASPRMEKHV